MGYLRHAVALHPKYVNGYLNLGLAEFKLGHDRQAIEYWENARYLYPDNPYLQLYYNVYGGILKKRAQEALEKGNPTEAIQQYRYLIVIAKNDWESWYLMAKAFQEKGESQPAMNCLRRSKALNPKEDKITKAMLSWSVRE